MCCSDIAYTSIYRNGAPRNKVQKIFQLKNQYYDFAFFGSSRVENHIDCELVKQLTGKSCINLGMAGTTIGDMLVMMKLANENGITFGNTVLQVDYNYNSTGLSKSFKANLTPFINSSAIVNKSLQDPLQKIPFYRYMHYDKVIGFRELTATALKIDSKIDLDNGFLPKFGEGVDTAGKIPEYFAQRNDEIEAIIKLSRDLGTKLHFFTAPFCKQMENRQNLEKLNILLPNLHNYYAMFDTNDSYFYNCGHLNIKGANKLTELLIVDLKTSQ
jgi:hypothetical protein